MLSDGPYMRRSTALRFTCRFPPLCRLVAALVASRSATSCRSLPPSSGCNAAAARHRAWYRWNTGAYATAVRVVAGGSGVVV